MINPKKLHIKKKTSLKTNTGEMCERKTHEEYKESVIHNPISRS